MPSHPRPTRRSEQGFSLMEVLVALLIIAIAVFPMMEIMHRSEAATFDAKFTSLACGKIRRLLSEITAMAAPGDEGMGDLSTLTEEEGFDARFSYANIYYDWKVEAADLSADIVSDNPDEGENSLDDSGSRDLSDPIKSPDEEVNIDKRYRARYVRISIYYVLSNDQENELTVETLLPPLPRKQEEIAEQLGQSDTVAPNTGS